MDGVAMAKRKRQSMDEFLAGLRDPEFLKQQAAREQERLAVEEALTRAELPILNDLKKAGADELGSPWDLLEAKQPYPKLIPVLLAHLDGDYPEKVREGIARALAVREARPGWSQLVRSFIAEPLLDEKGYPNQVKWALHLALAESADESVVDELIKLASDRRKHGQNRAFFVDALVRINGPHAVAALDELEGDPDLADAFKRVAKKRKRM